MDLVDDLGLAPQPLRQPPGELEAEIEPVGTDVERQIPGRRRSAVTRTDELTERMSMGWGSGADTLERKKYVIGEVPTPMRVGASSPSRSSAHELGRVGGRACRGS